MAEIRVTAAEVRKKAEELRSLNSQFQQKVEALVGSEQSLGSMWEGEAKNTFHTAFNNDKNQMDSFHTAIEQYAVALDNIAAEYEKREQMNQSIASQRTY